MSLAVTPTRPAYGSSTITASGTAIQLTGTWQHYAKVLIVLSFRSSTGLNWPGGARAYTDSAGHWKLRTPARGTGVWTAWLVPDATYLRSQSKNVSISVAH